MVCVWMCVVCGGVFVNVDAPRPRQSSIPSLFHPTTTNPHHQLHQQIVVLGGSGYVGSHVLQAALHRGAEPVVSVNRAGRPAHLEAAPWAGQVTWVRGELSSLCGGGGWGLWGEGCVWMEG